MEQTSKTVSPDAENRRHKTDLQARNPSRQGVLFRGQGEEQPRLVGGEVQGAPGDKNYAGVWGRRVSRFGLAVRRFRLVSRRDPGSNLLQKTVVCGHCLVCEFVPHNY